MLLSHTTSPDTDARTRLVTIPQVSGSSYFACDAVLGMRARKQQLLTQTCAPRPMCDACTPVTCACTFEIERPCFQVSSVLDVCCHARCGSLATFDTPCPLPDPLTPIDLLVLAVQEFVSWHSKASVFNEAATASSLAVVLTAVNSTGICLQSIRANDVQPCCNVVSTKLICVQPTCTSGEVPFSICVCTPWTSPCTLPQCRGLAGQFSLSSRHPLDGVVLD